MGYEAVVARAMAVGGWPGRGGGGFRPVRSSAHKQVVHDASRSPGCRSSHPLLWNHHHCLCLPSEAGGDDPDGMWRGGPLGFQQGEDPVLGKVLGKSAEEPGLGVCPAVPPEAWVWAYGLQGSM